jgi:hypothetical protein
MFDPSHVTSLSNFASNFVIGIVVLLPSSALLLAAEPRQERISLLLQIAIVCKLAAITSIRHSGYYICIPLQANRLMSSHPGRATQAKV